MKFQSRKLEQQVDSMSRQLAVVRQQYDTACAPINAAEREQISIVVEKFHTDQNSAYDHYEKTFFLDWNLDDKIAAIKPLLDKKQKDIEEIVKKYADIRAPFAAKLQDVRKKYLEAKLKLFKKYAGLQNKQTKTVKKQNQNKHKP